MRIYEIQRESEASKMIALMKIFFFEIVNNFGKILT